MYFLFDDMRGFDTIIQTHINRVYRLLLSTMFLLFALTLLQQIKNHSIAILITFNAIIIVISGMILFSGSHHGYFNK